MRFMIFFVQALSLTTASAQSEQAASAPGPSRSASGVGFASVAEALETLRAKPGVQVEVTKPDAWTVVSEPGNVQWSFTPSTHRAYPAVVRRAIKVNPEGYVYIEMSARCQAEKVHCDKLLEDFKELNERIRQTVRSRTQQAPN